MAVIDIAWFRPDIIDPASHVPTGIGAVAFLDRLQQHLKLDSHEQTCDAMIALQKEHWPEAKRPFQPIDVEYLSCECRKYFSYLNDTKQFEGKNLFKANENAQLTFDLDEVSTVDEPGQTQIHVIAGGPCSGKTTVLRALQQAGYRIEFETAEQALEEGIAEGYSAAELRVDPIHWQKKMLRKDYELFDKLPVDELIFTDTSFLETLVFGARAGIIVGPKIQSWLRRKRYRAVFFLDPLEDYEQSDVRLESHQIAMQISKQVQASYRHFGYEVIVVPAAPVAERVSFILSRIETV